MHDMSIEQFGGSYGVRDPGILEAVIYQPQAGFGNEYLYSFPVGMAVAYALGISRNHPFIGGNKRVAAAALGTFLEINGWELTCSDDDLVGFILNTATGALTRIQGEAWLSQHIRRMT